MDVNNCYFLNSLIISLYSLMISLYRYNVSLLIYGNRSFLGKQRKILCLWSICLVNGWIFSQKGVMMIGVF